MDSCFVVFTYVYNHTWVLFKEFLLGKPRKSFDPRILNGKIITICGMVFLIGEQQYNCLDWADKPITARKITFNVTDYIHVTEEQIIPEAILDNVSEKIYYAIWFHGKTSPWTETWYRGGKMLFRAHYNILLVCY